MVSVEQATVRRFQGTSTDIRPSLIGNVAPTDLPAGSTFLEVDTGTLYLWDGLAWVQSGKPDAAVPLLQAIDDKLGRLLELLTLATQIEV